LPSWWYLGGLVATPRGRLAFSKGKEKERKKKKSLPPSPPVTISFKVVVISDDRNVVSVPASQSELSSRDRRDADLGADSESRRGFTERRVVDEGGGG